VCAVVWPAKYATLCSLQDLCVAAPPQRERRASTSGLAECAKSTHQPHFLALVCSECAVRPPLPLPWPSSAPNSRPPALSLSPSPTPPVSPSSPDHSPLTLTLALRPSSAPGRLAAESRQKTGRKVRKNWPKTAEKVLKKCTKPRRTPLGRARGCCAPVDSLAQLLGACAARPQPTTHEQRASLPLVSASSSLLSVRCSPFAARSLPARLVALALGTRLSYSLATGFGPFFALSPAHNSLLATTHSPLATVSPFGRLLHWRAPVQSEHSLCAPARWTLRAAGPSA